MDRLVSQLPVGSLWISCQNSHDSILRPVICYDLIFTVTVDAVVHCNTEVADY